MKPYKIFVFLLVLFAIAFLISNVFPEKGIAINKMTLTFAWSFNTNEEAIQYADISEIVEEVIVEEDSIQEVEINRCDTVRAIASELRKKIRRIEYPAGDSSVLYGFFEKLGTANSKRIRILHYGDSQVEGDRITGYLRNKFQRQFGGSGPGLLPAIPGYAKSASIHHNASGNWRKHAVYYKKDTILPHREFGVLGSFGRFTSYMEDSLPNDTIVKQGWIEFNKSGMAYRSVQKFRESRVFYGHCNEPTFVKGYVNDSLIWFQTIDTIQEPSVFKWDFPAPPERFRIEFEGVKSPDLYGIALDDKTGVSVDNLPFRGSSGTEFTKLDYKHISAMVKHLNAGLVILEFGVNVVPHQVKGYKFYENALTRQLKYLKYLMPNASFLVVGLSDMSQKQGDFYATYPNVEMIRDAQRNAARNANCAFWDMYEAMGGKNSMPSWVFAKPPLAQKDFTHFNRKGGHIIAQMLYNAIMEEYRVYQDLTRILH